MGQPGLEVVVEVAVEPLELLELLAELEVVVVVRGRPGQAGRAELGRQLELQPPRAGQGEAEPPQAGLELVLQLPEPELPPEPELEPELLLELVPEQELEQGLELELVWEPEPRLELLPVQLLLLPVQLQRLQL